MIICYLIVGTHFTFCWHLYLPIPIFDKNVDYFKAAVWQKIVCVGICCFCDYDMWSEVKQNCYLLLPLGGAITRPLQDVTVAESQTAELECEVANANAEGKWLKEGQPIDFNENVVSEVNGAIRRLVINITRPQDVGEYTYQVANSKTTANLRVEGKY